MVIFHNPHDKISREFVEKYGKNDTILTYPYCLTTYPNISAFPSVLLDVPEHIVPATTIQPPLDENGVPLTDPDGNVMQAITIPEQYIPAHQIIFRTQHNDYTTAEDFWEEIQLKLQELAELSQ